MNFWLRNRLPVREEPAARRRTRGATQARQKKASAVGVFFSLSGELMRVIPWSKVALGAVVALAAGMTPWVVSHGIGAMDREFNAVAIEGDLNRLEQQTLQESLEPWLGRSYFATDLSAVKSWVEQQPWVQSAAISRQWPGTLTVDVIEHHPVAYWNGRGLLNREGEVFSPVNPAIAGAIPELYGPPGKAGVVLERARAFAAEMAPSDLRLARMELESRGAWTLQLDNGISVSLGRDRVEERFARFLSVYRSHLKPVAAGVKRIDARYGNGVSVEWRDTETVAARGDQT